MNYRKILCLIGLLFCTTACRDSSKMQSPPVQPVQPSAVTGQSPVQPGQSPAQSSQPAGQPGSVIAIAAQGDPPRQFGSFEFVVPVGWTIVTPDREKTVAMLLLDGTSWQDCRAMIKIDVVDSADATSQILATVGAPGENARPERIDFDGTSGTRTSKASTSMSEPQITITLIRNQRVSFFMVGAMEGVDVTDAIESIRNSWKWID